VVAYLLSTMAAIIGADVWTLLSIGSQSVSTCAFYNDLRDCVCDLAQLPDSFAEEVFDFDKHKSKCVTVRFWKVPSGSAIPGVVVYCRFPDLCKVNWRITRASSGVIRADYDSSFVPDEGLIIHIEGLCHTIAISQEHICWRKLQLKRQIADSSNRVTHARSILIDDADIAAEAAHIQVANGDAGATIIPTGRQMCKFKTTERRAARAEVHLDATEELEHFLAEKVPRGVDTDCWTYLEMCDLNNLVIPFTADYLLNEECCVSCTLQPGVPCQ
jgi:hypothetical protein